MNKSILLLMVCFYFWTAPVLACPQWTGEPPTEKDLSITESSFNFSAEEKVSVITTIGKITNSADACLQRPVVEVNYYDSNKVLIDTASQEIYGLVIPAHGFAQFKIEDKASRPKDNYASHTVRILSADAKDGAARRDGFERTWQYALNWAPLFIFVGALFLLLRRMQKGGTQARYMAILEEQTAHMRAGNELRTRIASALENKQK